MSSLLLSGWLNFLIVCTAGLLALSGTALLRAFLRQLRGCAIPPSPLGVLAFLTLTYAAALFLLLGYAKWVNTNFVQLAMLYYSFAAPCVALFLCVILSGERHLSPAHRIAFYAAGLYFPIWLLTGLLGILYVLANIGG